MAKHSKDRAILLLQILTIAALHLAPTMQNPCSAQPPLDVNGPIASPTSPLLLPPRDTPADPLPNRTRGSEKPLEKMTLEEMRRVGYIFAREQKPLFSSTDLRMALTLGIIGHGTGHFALGEVGAGGFLLGLEIGGVLLTTGGALLPKLYDESPALDIVATTMASTGITLAIASWLMDVSGTIRANGRRLGEARGPADGLSIGLGYRLIKTDPSPVSHMIDIDIGYQSRWFFISASTLQDVELKYQDYKVELGTRFLRDAKRSSDLGISTYAEYDTYLGLGEYREISTGGKVFGSLDMGYLFPTLTGTSFGFAVGWDLHFPYLLDDGKHFRKSQLRHAYLFSFFSRFGISDALTLTIGYQRHENVLISPSAIPFGTFFTEFRYVTEGESDISLGLEVSEGVVIWIKGRIHLLD